MSQVFVATESALGRDVVIKTIAPELLEGGSAARFTLEVKLAARLQQANIVPLLSAGDANGVPYYTMPFVSGLSLRTRIAKGPIPISEAAYILRDIAKALAYAHEQGVVHRDIKPENVLLSGGTAMVTDFGIAKALTASRTADGSGTATGLTMAGSALGTPAYMAPEQAVGSVVDHRADLYAWGVLGYEMLTGAHPFAASNTPQKIIAAHIAELPVPIRQKNAAIPHSLAAAVMRSLEKDPDKRPASATELLAALDAATTPGSTNTASTRSSSWRLGATLGIASVVVAVIVWAAVSRRGTAVGSTASTDRSLAVLPFASVGGDTANAYFAEGIADELTTALSRLPGLRLAGRSSAARFKARNASAQEIGAALKVFAVLDGTVRRAGNRIRVSAELTNAGDGRLLWKEQYERDVKDVFAVQDDITRAIVGALQVRLVGGATSADAGSQGTTNLAAYDLYLRGLQFYRKRGAALAQAESLLTQAIALDPRFARAHAMLASVLTVQPYYYDTVSMAQVLPRARVAALRAVELNDDLADAHQALGHVHTEAFEWTRAEAELRRAVALNPNSYEAFFRLGFLLLGEGRVKEAVVVFEQGKALDPFYAVSASYLGLAYALAGRDADALSEANRAIELDSTSESVGTLYSNTLVVSKHCPEAIPFAQRRLRRSVNIRRRALYGSDLADCGVTADARAVRSEIEALPAHRWGRQSSLTFLNLALGDTARGLEALEEAMRGDGDLTLAQTIGSPRYDTIRGSPRFAALLRRLNLNVERLTAPDGGRSR